MQYGFTWHSRSKMRQLGLTVDAVMAIIVDRDVIERYAGRDGELLLYGMEVLVSVVRQDAPRIGLDDGLPRRSRRLPRRSHAKEVHMNRQGFAEGQNCPACTLGGSSRWSRPAKPS